MGPVTLAELRAKIGHGEVLSTDLAWRDGMVDWMQVSQIPELKPSAAAASSSTLSSDSMGALPQIPATSAPAGPQSSASSPQQTSALAVVSLVCGAIGVVGSFICCIPGAIGILGIILGHMALSEIKKSNGQKGGREIALIGIICGYLALAILLLQVLFFGLLTTFSAPKGIPVETPGTSELNQPI